ncbi:bile acid:Na+ symporter, BASS family [Marivirga sericea]|uniref:Bile acid:Na+ symporter, BASS family n=1 Tax=Marivirga sericea TaxID=1028 RepID=A0A1X7I9S1_9BACT|nr:bile acid:sodium symporter family protein [Marivirga sericea]SMG10864.1 bile acid:Na+ symporter, BASS family [Marivirga sericea]
MQQSFVDFIMPFAIAVIMLGIGLELKFKDFERVFIQPKAVITGIASQMILMPVIALGLIYFWPIDPVYKVGLMLLAACPGGTASNLVTKLLGGRVALSISMTAFNSFIILFTIPAILKLSFYLFLGKEQSIDLSFWQTTAQVFYTVIIPATIGVLVNEFSSERFTDPLKKPLKYILPIILIVALLAVVFLDEDNKEVNYLDHLNLLIPLIIFNVITMLFGYRIGKLLGLRHDSNYTIAIEMGLQNSVLALFIANQVVEISAISTMAILYSSFSFITTFGIAFLMQKRVIPGFRG